MIGRSPSIISFLSKKISTDLMKNSNRLMKEESGGNWLYSIDGLAPLEI